MPEETTQDRLLTVVISAGQSRNPQKRELEQSVANQLAHLMGVEVLTIPHLYDLAADSKSFETLRSIDSDLVVISWLYDRAAHWVLDRNNISGQTGEVELKLETGEDEEEDEATEASSEETVTQLYPRPTRSIYCLDFRASESAADFIKETTRILKEDILPEDEGREFLSLESLARFAEPQNDTYVGAPQRKQKSLRNPPTSSETLV